MFVPKKMKLFCPLPYHWFKSLEKVEFLFNAEEVESKKIKLEGRLLINNLEISSYIDDYVSIVHHNTTINVIFHEQFENIFIHVLDREDNIIFRQKTNTLKSFHLFIDTEKWASGEYCIFISKTHELYLNAHFVINSK